MSDFAGMEELLQDFLTESSELLSDVDNKLVELEKYPEDKGLLNDIFRGFHTIKGGAGFLNATPLVTLCHRTENLFDKIREASPASDLPESARTDSVFPKAYFVLEVFFTDTNLYQFTTNIAIPEKTTNAKNIRENVFSKLLVVSISNPRLAS
jgi:chemotaxis protein histidine kinase CheA